MTAIVTPPTIDDLPPAPLPTDTIPEFNTKAFALAAALDDLVDQTNASAAATNQNATAANERAVAADASKVAAALSETNAATSAASALTAPGTQATSTTSLALTTGAKSATIQTGKSISPGQQFVWARASAPSTRMFTRIDSYDSGTGAINFTSLAVEGSGTYSDWVVSMGVASVAGTPDLPRVTRTSNTALVDADKGKWIDITSGSFTQTFGTRSPGWWCILGNSGTGDVDLTTDGVSYKMYPGEIRRLVYDGTTTYSILIHAYYKVFTASGLWYKAPGYLAFAGAVQATGASGDRRATGTNRSGGGGGALAPFRYTADQLSATEGVVIGSPGAANTVNSTSGTAGGNCSFKTTIAQGGRAGGGGAQGATGGYAYSGTTNPMTAGGDEAGTRDTFYGGGGATLSGVYGGTVHGASAGDSISAANARVPAVQSILGPAGGTCNAAGTVITPGAGPGAGGAASTNGTNSGAGMPGEVRIWGEF